MRIVHMTAAAVLGLAAASGLRFVYADGEGQARAASIVGVSGAETGAYRLAIYGQAGNCVLWPGQRIDETSRALDLSDGCDGVGVKLARARMWIERPHGDVVLADASGQALIEFGASDGAAFESFRPLEPMMTLTALR